MAEPPGYRFPLSDDAIAAHDQQRDLPEAMWDDVLGRLSALIPEDGPCVDVGVGTGAVARRLARRGVDVIGLDCNRSMLRSLVMRESRLPVVLGDACWLPLAGGSAVAVVLANVLHLVADWQTALDQIRRVVRPGGVIALNLGSGSSGKSGVAAKFREFLGREVDQELAGPQSPEEVVNHLRAVGCPMATTLETSGQTARTVDEMITRLELNPFVWPPDIDRQTLRKAAAATREWSKGRGPLDRPSLVDVQLRFFVFQRQ